MLAALVLSWVFFIQPPAELQHDNTATVQFLNRWKMTRYCEGLGVDGETSIAACTRGSYIVLPNPCDWPIHESYQELACHELGHRNEAGSGNWHARTSITIPDPPTYGEPPL